MWYPSFNLFRSHYLQNNDSDNATIIACSLWRTTAKEYVYYDSLGFRRFLDRYYCCSYIKLVIYSSNWCWVSLLRVLILSAAASVIAPPNPNICWYFWLLSNVRTLVSDIFLTSFSEKLLMEYSIILPSLVEMYQRNWSFRSCGTFIVSQYVELQMHTLPIFPNESDMHPSPTTR